MNSKDERLKNDLVLYARTGKADLLGELIQKLNGECDFMWGAYTPLGHAAERGRPTTVRLLLEQGASVTRKDTSGHTPLMLAAYRGSLECVQMLLAAGSDAEAKSEDGRKALDFARKAGHSRIVALLTAYTSDPWDPSRLDLLEQPLAAAVRDFIERSNTAGWRGEVQPVTGVDCVPMWYSTLLSTVPLAGRPFVCHLHEMIEEGGFMSSQDIRSLLEEEVYVTEFFLKDEVWPFATASDGSYWTLEIAGTPLSPVRYWNHSGESSEVAYNTFPAFLNSAQCNF